MEEKIMESWSMEDLIALTDEVQSEDMNYKGKTVKIQWCELVEAEEPKMAIPSEDTPEEEKNEYYTKLASEKVMKMIEKANEKNPDGAFLSPDVWEKLPTTLKYKISSKIMGTDAEVNF
tara:strand:+ start:1063 stop:1419 length:357 start_codon:yes stop_codon:yes gene_type:complete